MYGIIVIKLTDLTEEEFNKLKQSGMLWEFYPDSTDNYKETMKNKAYENSLIQKCLYSKECYNCNGYNIECKKYIKNE